MKGAVVVEVQHLSSLSLPRGRFTVLSRKRQVQPPAQLWHHVQYWAAASQVQLPLKAGADVHAAHHVRGHGSW